jgi:hypothetical protein
MADETPPIPAPWPPEDARPRIGPHGELVSEDGLHYWTGKHWVALESPFAPIPGATFGPVESKYDTKVVTWVAVVSAIVLSIGVSAVVFVFPPAIALAVVLAIAAAIFLVLARDHSKAVKSWAFGLLIGAGVALLISPGAACFGLFMGPSA